VAAPPAVDRPSAYALRAGVPNPFRAGTRVMFDLPQAGDTWIAIYDIQGRLVRTLVRERLPVGRHVAAWSGRDETDRVVAPGVYFVRMQSGSFSATGKVVRLD
jgi:flagellar hook assembly protein FlgD